MGEEVMRAGKWICGSIVGFWGLLAPVQVLILCVCVAIIVDFITGNIADYKRHKRAHQNMCSKARKCGTRVGSWGSALSVLAWPTCLTCMSSRTWGSQPCQLLRCLHRRNRVLELSGELRNHFESSHIPGSPVVHGEVGQQENSNRF